MTLKPIIDVSATMGDKVQLVDITKRYIKSKDEKGDYKNTNEFFMAYSVVALTRKFEKIDVKIEERNAIFPLDENGKAIGIPDDCLVEFEGLVVTPYVNNGWIQLSAKADKCMVKEDKEKRINLKGYSDDKK